jgi:hypothetical protein
METPSHPETETHQTLTSLLSNSKFNNIKKVFAIPFLRVESSALGHFRILAEIRQVDIPPSPHRI